MFQTSRRAIFLPALVFFAMNSVGKSSDPSGSAMPG
jgi:hypothetical protein